MGVCVGVGGVGGADGIRDVSNVDRMGKDEVQLVNEMIDGVVALIKWEKELVTSANNMSKYVDHKAWTMHHTDRCETLAKISSQCLETVPCLFRFREVFKI